MIKGRILKANNSIDKPKVTIFTATAQFTSSNFSLVLLVSVNRGWSQKVTQLIKNYNRFIVAMRLIFPVDVS